MTADGQIMVSRNQQSAAPQHIASNRWSPFLNDPTTTVAPTTLPPSPTTIVSGSQVMGSRLGGRTVTTNANGFHSFRSPETSFSQPASNATVHPTTAAGPAAEHDNNAAAIQSLVNQLSMPASSLHALSQLQSMSQQHQHQQMYQRHTPAPPPHHQQQQQQQQQQGTALEASLAQVLLNIDSIVNAAAAASHGNTNEQHGRVQLPPEIHNLLHGQVNGALLPNNNDDVGYVHDEEKGATPKNTTAVKRNGKQEVGGGGGSGNGAGRRGAEEDEDWHVDQEDDGGGGEDEDEEFDEDDDEDEEEYAFGRRRRTGGGGSSGGGNTPRHRVSVRKNAKTQGAPLSPISLHAPPNQKQQQQQQHALGRPITYKGDPSDQHLTEEERRRLKRRIANRESARRVRQKRQELLEELQEKVTALTHQNARLLTHIATNEQSRQSLHTHVAIMGERLTAKSSECTALLAENGALKKALQERGMNPNDAVQRLNGNKNTTTMTSPGVGVQRQGGGAAVAVSPLGPLRGLGGGGGGFGTGFSSAFAPVHTGGTGGNSTPRSSSQGGGGGGAGSDGGEQKQKHHHQGPSATVAAHNQGVYSSQLTGFNQHAL